MEENFRSIGHAGSCQQRGWKKRYSPDPGTVSGSECEERGCGNLMQRPLLTINNYDEFSTSFVLGQLRSMSAVPDWISSSEF